MAFQLISWKTLAAACLLALPMAAQTGLTPQQEQNLKKELDALRKDLRKDKQAMVDEAMGLEAGDKAKFWGVYEKYQKELTALWDARFANVKKYADNYTKMTDAVAEDLAATSLNNDQKLVELRRKYYAAMKTTLGSKVAARFLQVEGMFDHLSALQMLSNVPLLQ